MLTMHKKLNIGLIGLGSMGKNHLRILSSLRDINRIFVYDIDLKNIFKNKNDEHIIFLDSLDKVFKNVDAIIIATPTITHFEMIKNCIGKVKNIFVEKPLCSNINQAVQIKNLCEQNNILISVGFIERFNSVMKPLKSLYNQNCINTDFFRTDKVSSRIKDVDVISDLMIHDIDLAIYLNGNIVNSYGHGKFLDNQIAFACATLVHENGSYSRLTASKLTEKKMRYIESTFEDKFVNCNLLSKEIEIYRQSIYSVKETDQLNIDSTTESVHLLPAESLREEIDAYINRCQNILNKKTSILADHNDGLSAQRICDKIRKYINLNQPRSNLFAINNI